MGRQKFREAIPKGINGAKVYDKVGFYGNAWHNRLTQFYNL